MNTERIINLVMMEMTMEKMKTEEEIERYINRNDISIDDKTLNIKNLIYRLSSTENAIATFSNMLNNNNNTKEKEIDGQDLSAPLKLKKEPEINKYIKKKKHDSLVVKINYYDNCFSELWIPFNG